MASRGKRSKPPIRKEREFVRVPLCLVADYREYRSPDSRPGPEISKIRNISGNGLLLEANRRMEPGVLLEISLRIPGWHRYQEDRVRPDWTAVPELLTIIGTVVRCVETVLRERFDVGVAFSRIDPGDRTALLQYLKEYAEDRRG